MDNENKSAFAGGTKVTFNSSRTNDSENSINTVDKKFNSGYSQQAFNLGNNNNNISSSQVSYDADFEKKKNRKTFFIAFAGAIVACLLFLFISSVFNFGKGTILGSTSNSSIANVDDSDTLAEAVSKKCLPSVVAINVYTNQTSLGLKSSSLALSSMGSGVIISKEGHILTNQHVIDGANALKVTANGQVYDAEKIGEDSSSDIAVIKLKDANNLSSIELGNSDQIKIGQWVMAIGSPFGLEQSVSTGIVSAKSRSQVVSSQSDGSTKVYTNLVQTDAAINPGNSGGALVDKDGHLIGINALIQSSSGNNSGVGFAIPVNYAIDLSKQIIDGKTPTHAQLGVSMVNVDSSTAKQYGWSVNKGAYVSGVEKGSAADNAGIKVGDIIVKFEDKEISTTSDLLLGVRSHNPGDSVKVTFNRSGEEKTVDITLGSDEGKSQTQEKKENSSSNKNSNDLEDLFKKYFGY